MKNLSIVNISILWLCFVIVVIIGNVFFGSHWQILCEVLQIVNMCLVICLSVNIYNSISRPEQKQFKWFIVYNSFLCIAGILYFIVNNILHLPNTNNYVSLSYFILGFFWTSTAFIHWWKTVKKIQFKNNKIALLAVLLINLCLAYMLYKLPLKPVMAMPYQFVIFQTYTNIISFVTFNFALCVLICAINMGTRLVAAGFISIIGAHFLTSYIMYTYNPLSIYKNDFWLFSSCILVFGLIFIKKISNPIITPFINERSIKNIIVVWTLSIIVITASLFLVLADYFNVLTPQMLAILPYIMVIYIILAVFMALAISSIFEVPIREINNTIHNFIEHPEAKQKNKINIAEFMVLNDFLLYTMRVLEERNYHERLRAVVRQMMHDITSPIASIDNIVAKLSNNVPKADRVTLRNASERIAGISQKMLSQYDSKKIEDKKETFLLSLALLQIINERRENYLNTGIIIEVNIDKSANFACIRHSSEQVKRMIANLVNNAVEALDGKPGGKVTISLSVFAGNAVIVINDNGYGMAEHIQDKFRMGIEVTEDKKGGHGIGLTQVRDTINSGGGVFDVNADQDGTQIVIRFPRVATPYWISEKIELTIDDTLVILDDDESMHGFWARNLESILKKYPMIKIKNFTGGRETIAYINSLSIEQKRNIFLLTDFELLGQAMNGFDVVIETNIRRTVLVTSYFAYSDVLDQARAVGVKMLPKELAHDVQIIVDKKIQKWSNRVDMVWVEDQRWWVDDLVARYYSHLKVDVYYDPISFMQDVHQYPLDTRIILDSYFETEDGLPYTETGFDLAKQLHAIGYTKLILYVGEDPKGVVPEYLTIIRKKDRYATENIDKI